MYWHVATLSVSESIYFRVFSTSGDNDSPVCSKQTLIGRRVAAQHPSPSALLDLPHSTFVQVYQSFPNFPRLALHSRPTWPANESPMYTHHSRAWRLLLIVVGIALNLVRVVLGYQTHVVSASLPMPVVILVTDSFMFLDRGRERRKLLRPTDSDGTGE